MSRSSVLVSQVEVSQDTVAHALGRVESLADYEIVGDLSVGDEAVEISHAVGGPLFAVFASRDVDAEGARDYTTGLGLEAPLIDGRCWLTEVTSPTNLDDEALQALVDFLSVTAAECLGYVVTDGEYAVLPGALRPQPATRDDASAALDERQLFMSLDFAVAAGGLEGTAWMMGQLDRLTGSELVPDRIQTFGGLEPFDLAELLDSGRMPRGDSFVLHRKRRPESRWSLWKGHFPGDDFSSINVATALATGDADALVGRLRAVAGAGNGLDYAALAAWHDDDAVAPAGLWAYDDAPEDESRRKFILTAHDLRQWLPDLYWAQVFGPPWVALWGSQHLAATPAHRCEEVAPDTWLVQLTEHLSDVTERREHYVAARQAAKDHLGPDCFFDPIQRYQATYRAATIPTLGERGLVD